MLNYKTSSNGIMETYKFTNMSDGQDGVTNSSGSINMSDFQKDNDMSSNEYMKNAFRQDMSNIARTSINDMSLYALRRSYYSSKDMYKKAKASSKAIGIKNYKSYYSNMSNLNGDELIWTDYGQGIYSKRKIKENAKDIKKLKSKLARQKLNLVRYDSKTVGYKQAEKEIKKLTKTIHDRELLQNNLIKHRAIRSGYLRQLNPLSGTGKNTMAQINYELDQQEETRMLYSGVKGIKKGYKSSKLTVKTIRSMTRIIKNVPKMIAATAKIITGIVKAIILIVSNPITLTTFGVIALSAIILNFMSVSTAQIYLTAPEEISQIKENIEYKANKFYSNMGNTYLINRNSCNGTEECYGQKINRITNVKQHFNLPKDAYDYEETIETNRFISPKFFFNGKETSDLQLESPGEVPEGFYDFYYTYLDITHNNFRYGIIEEDINKALKIMYPSSTRGWLEPREQTKSFTYKQKVEVPSTCSRLVKKIVEVTGPDGKPQKVEKTETEYFPCKKIEERTRKVEYEFYTEQYYFDYNVNSIFTAMPELEKYYTQYKYNKFDDDDIGFMLEIAKEENTLDTLKVYNKNIKYSGTYGYNKEKERLSDPSMFIPLWGTNVTKSNYYQIENETGNIPFIAFTVVNKTDNSIKLKDVNNNYIIEYINIIPDSGLKINRTYPNPGLLAIAGKKNNNDNIKFRFLFDDKPIDADLLFKTKKE